MRKVFPYLVLLLFVCVSCSSDDSEGNSYKTITAEEKELLIGKWQLIYYSNKAGDIVDVWREGSLYYHTFRSNGTFETDNVSTDRIQFTTTAMYMTGRSLRQYQFDVIDDKDVKVGKKEQLFLLGDLSTLRFDLEVSKDKLTLTEIGGDVFTFKRAKDTEVEYPPISKEDKYEIMGSWKLKEILRFDGRKRNFEDEEQVLYHFGSNKVFVVENNSASLDGVFDAWIKSREKTFNFCYDFERHKKEVMNLEDLGLYNVRVKEKELILDQYDGALIKFSRME